MSDSLLKCGGCLGLIALLAGSITYTVFGIMFLINDYEVCHDCDDSHLWEYVLVILILQICSGKGGSSTNSNKDNEENYLVLLIIGIIQGGFAIWGGIELFDKANKCEDVKNSDIWIWGVVSFSIQCLIAFIGFCPLLYFTVKGCLSCVKNIQTIQVTEDTYSTNLQEDESSEECNELSLHTNQEENI